MLQKTLIIGCLMSLSQIAMAGTGLEGAWKFTRTQCSSGVSPRHESLNSDGETMGADMLVVVEADRIHMKSQIEAHLTKEAADRKLEHIRFTYEMYRSEPDSLEKQALFDRLKKSESRILRSASVLGFKCELNDTLFYSVSTQESKIHLGEPIDSSSTCDGEFFSNYKNFGPTIEYKLDGETLKLLGDKAQNVDACPSGDSEDSVFVRIK